MSRNEFGDWDKMELEEDEEDEEEEGLDDLDNLEEEEEIDEDEDEENPPALSHKEKVRLHSEKEGWELADQDDEVEDDDGLALGEEPDIKDKTVTAHGKDKKERPQKSKRRASVVERKKQPGLGSKRAKRPGTTKSKGGSRRK